MPVLEEVLAASRGYAASEHTPDMGLGIRRRLVVLTCMDLRLLPEHFLGLAQGDAEVIRNGGGRVTDDVIRSLIVCQDVLHCDTVLVIHHTGVDMHPIYDLDESVREDVSKLWQSEHVQPDTALYGLVFETASGQLRLVCSNEGGKPEPTAA